MFPRKSPHSLPASQYGGGRKRIFIGLMLASCIAICLALFGFLVLPWLIPTAVIGLWLPMLSISLGLTVIFLLAWLCATLIFHIYTGWRLPGISWVRHILFRLFLPFMESLGRLCGFGRDAVRRSFVKVNNELVLAKGIRVPASELLLLLPHCVQNSACRNRISPKADNCQRCALCQVGPLLDLRDKFGFRLALATGGTIARRIVVECRPAFILAVACERDLVSGIQDSYPLPVFGVLNERPHGPCQDTRIPLRAVETALERFLLPCEESLPSSANNEQIS